MFEPKHHSLEDSIKEYSPFHKEPSLIEKPYALILLGLLLIPLMFVFGWVAHEELTGPNTSGIEVGVGGGPETSASQPILSPIQDSMLEKQLPEK